MDELDEGNLISTISKFNRCYLKLLKEDVPASAVKKWNKKMMSYIFQSLNESQATPLPSFEDLHSLIRTRIVSLFSADSSNHDDDREDKIRHCLAALEELTAVENRTEELNAVLSCLYTLSKFNKMKHKRSKNVSQEGISDSVSDRRNKKRSDFHNLKMLFSNSSSKFNEINWNFVKSIYAVHKNISETPKSSTSKLTKELYLDSPRFNDINWDLFKTRTSEHNICSAGSRVNSDPFNDIFSYKVWNFESNKPIDEPFMPDEGFITPGSNFSEELSDHSNTSESETLISMDIAENDMILETSRQARFIWEQQGCQWLQKEPKFASEYSESILRLWKIWNITQPVRHPVPLGLQIDFEEFKTDIRYLIFGMASNSFYFAPITKSFHVRENLHLSMITPEALVSFCHSFLECGNNLIALKNFAESKSKINNFGPIHRVFCTCVQSSLQMHRYGLLNIKWECINLLLLLETYLSPFKRKLAFIRNLCTVCVPDQNCSNKQPHGVRLLDRLYTSLVEIETTDFKFILLYFFESCCNIYLKIVSEWLFNGCFSNPANYDEFFIQIQHELELCWDWRRLSYVRVNEKRIPKFLEKFFKDIFACGKSVNLLRIFSRKEIFERLLPKKHPSLRCCFNSAQIEVYALEWKRFQAHFYKKHDWHVKLKDRLTENYSADFYNSVKETRRKWFVDFESRQREERSSRNTNELPKSDDRKSPIISNDQYDATETAKTDCSSTVVSSITKSSEAVKQDPLNMTGESGDCSSNKTCNISSSECTNLNDSKFESKLTGTVPSSVFEGAGDSTHALQPTCIPSVIQTEYQRNIQKSRNSDQVNQSSTTEIPRLKFTSSPLNVCAQNRLKNMSTTFNDDPNRRNVGTVTSMSDRMRNKMNVMRSEYYERLSECNPVHEKKTVDQKPSKNSECEQNKLKVMSSEYHIRLNELAEQEVPLSSKSSSESNTRTLPEREIYKQKVLSEEFHQFPKTNIKIKNTVNDDIGLEDTIEDILKKNASVERNNGDFMVDSAAMTVIEEETRCDLVEVSKRENVSTLIESSDKTIIAEQSAIKSIDGENILDMKQYCKYPNIFPKPVTKATSLLLTQADSVKDVDITSILYYLSSSISIPLRIQSNLVNEAILWVFIEQEGYLEHLKSLKNYLLLRKAEFSLSLTNSLFEMSEEVKTPLLLLNSYTLNSILQRALSTCSSRNLAKFERNLSFILEHPIPDSFDMTDVQMFRCLSMHYTVRWPVNVLITEPIVKKYSRIFRFLIQLQRVSWVLKIDYRDMKNLKQGKSIQYTQVQLYRHTMTQVIRLLKDYVMREALEKCWNDLIHHLMNIKINLDELYITHLKYINKIIQRCFLCDDSVLSHKAILNVFNSVLKYHDALRKGCWRRNEECNLLYHTNFKILQTAYQEFGKNLDNFRSVLKALVYQKQKMYLESLFLELSYNMKNETEL